MKSCIKCSFIWNDNRNSNTKKPVINHSVLIASTHGVFEGEWTGKHWIQYRWSCKIDDSDVLYWTELSNLLRIDETNSK